MSSCGVRYVDSDIQIFLLGLRTSTLVSPSIKLTHQKFFRKKHLRNFTSDQFIASCSSSSPVVDEPSLLRLNNIDAVVGT